MQPLTEFMQRLEELTVSASQIDKNLFETCNVKRGLRNQDGSGVWVGLTNIGDVVGYLKKDDQVSPCHGKLYYRGIDVEDLVHGFQKDKRHGFDETVYLLLTGKLPNKLDLGLFTSYMAGWCAHRLEEVTFSSKRSIRPAYKNVFGRVNYEFMDDRK